MIDKETELNMTDWELSEDYYKEREGKQELKLEGFYDGEDEIPSLVSGRNRSLCWLRQSPMCNVLSVCQEGNLCWKSPLPSPKRRYVHTILYCAQGFSEDDPIAVARLVMMS